jgi:hypothetical protein
MSKFSTVERNAGSELVARYAPFRASIRPFECTRATPCWVDDPYAATGNKKNTGIMCLTCLGPICPRPSKGFLEFQASMK